jgi:hypothetical protein
MNYALRAIGDASVDAKVESRHGRRHCHFMIYAMSH